MAIINFNVWMNIGGSANAAGELIKNNKANTLEYLFIIDLPFLGGRNKLSSPSYAIVEAED